MNALGGLLLLLLPELLKPWEARSVLLHAVAALISPVPGLLLLPEFVCVWDRRSTGSRVAVRIACWAFGPCSVKNRRFLSWATGSRGRLSNVTRITTSAGGLYSSFPSHVDINRYQRPKKH